MKGISDCFWPRTRFRRSRSLTLPHFEISMVNVDNNRTIRKVCRSLDDLPSAAALSHDIKKEENEGNSSVHCSSPAVLSSDFFLDECPALLSQVPDSFDLGRTRVRINSIAASVRYIAVGSECGALFLFNVRIGQSVKPLRTDNCEVISTMEFCSNGGDDNDELLALGHRSGKVVILSLPCVDSANRKLLQHVQDEAHRHSAVQCLCWSFDGRMLFSGDEMGMILATHVDFTNGQFPIGVIETCGLNGGTIVGMLSSGPFLTFAKGPRCKVCNWQKDNETVAEVTLQKEIIAIHIFPNLSDQLSLLLSDGTVFRKDFSASGNGLSELGSISFAVFHDQQIHVVPFFNCDGPSWALWAQNGHIEICSLRAEEFTIEKVALDGRMDQVLSMCASTCSSSDELFVLSAPSVHPLQQRRRIFRLSRLSAVHPSLTVRPLSPPNGHSLLFGYLYGTVEKALDEFGRLKKSVASGGEGEGTETRRIFSHGTEELLSRLNRDLDVFLMGNGAKVAQEAEAEGKTSTNSILADFLPEFGSVLPESTATFASGLNQIFGHIRQQSSNLFFTSAEESSLQNELDNSPQSTCAEIDRLSLGDNSTIFHDNNCQMRQRRDSFAQMSLPPTEFSCSAGIEDEREGGDGGHLREYQQFDDAKFDEENKNANVRVERKRIVLRRKRKKNRGQMTTADGEDEEGGGKQRETSQGQQRQEDADYGQESRKTNWDVMEEGRADGWTPGAVTDDRQQQILEVLGIVPEAPMAPKDDDLTEIPPSLNISDCEPMMRPPLTAVYDKRDEANSGGPMEEEPGGEGKEHWSKSATYNAWERGNDDAEQMANLQIGSVDGGYAFPTTTDDDALCLEEEECPSIVPAVSLADLVALFPPPSLHLSPAVPIVQPILPPLPLSSSSISGTFSSSSLSSVPIHSLSPLYQRLLRLSTGGSHWRRLDAPFTVAEFTLCRHYLIACPATNKRSAKGNREKKKRPHYLMANLLEDERAVDEWVPLRVSASAVAVNDEGTLLWRMCDGVAYSPCSPPDPICPSTTLSRTTVWVEMSNQFEGDIVQIALNSKNAWFLADTGRTRKERTVWTQMFLPEMGIFHRAVDEDNRHFFTQLAVSDHAVWTLSGGLVVARVGLKLDLAPMGLDWADIDVQPHKFVSISLHKHSGFGLERNGTVWFVHGVAENAPFGHGPWFKVCFPPALPSLGLSPQQFSSLSSEWRLHVGIPGVFIVADSALLFSNAPLVGFHFEHVVPDRLVLNDHFTMIAATGFCGLANDCLFLCQPSSDELFSFSLRKRHFTSLPSYCSDCSSKIQCLSATSTCLFVLDRSGHLYVRPVGLRPEGQGHDGRMGRHWAMVQTPNSAVSLTEKGEAFARNAASTTKFVSVAACASSIWTVSEDGSIWVSRSLAPSSSPVDCGDPSSYGNPIDMVWTKIDGPTDGGPVNQVRVSPSGNSVWVFFKSGFGWYRTEITDSNWMGREWATSNTIQSICINELAAGDTAIWALAVDTHQLHLLSSMGWLPLDVRLQSLSVDAVDGRLWALDNEFRIVRHEIDVITTHLSTEIISSDDVMWEDRRENVTTTKPTRKTTKEIRQPKMSLLLLSAPPTESAHWAFNIRKMFSFFR